MEWRKDMAPIYVLFWFDVEDYVTPEADDALKRLIETFDAQGVRATWKLVGEKLQVLERRGRGGRHRVAETP